METQASKPLWKSLGLLVTLGAIGLLIYSSTSGGRHSVDPEDVQKNPKQFVGKPIKIEGTVVLGSFKPNPKDSLDFAFAIKGKSGATFQVRHRGVLPDPFAEDRQVIIVGKLNAQHEIQSAKITVKCPSRYEEQKYTKDQMQAYKKRMKTKVAKNNPAPH